MQQNLKMFDQWEMGGQVVRNRFFGIQGILVPPPLHPRAPSRPRPPENWIARNANHGNGAENLNTEITQENHIFLPFCEEVEHLFGWGESPIGGEEDVDVRGLELPRVAGERFHQLLHRARLDETHLKQHI